MQTIKAYLTLSATPFRESENEVIIPCFFGDCGDKSKGNEGYLHLNTATGQFSCEKCDVSGSLINLAKNLLVECLEIYDASCRDDGNEIIADCLFDSCYRNKNGRGRLSFNVEKGQYECAKCGAKGNLITFMKFLETL